MLNVIGKDAMLQNNYKGGGQVRGPPTIFALIKLPVVIY